VNAGSLIRELRRGEKLSQRKLALRAGTSQAAISHIERGTRDVGMATLERILLALGYRLAQLRAERLPLDIDKRHLWAELEAPMADRLQRALAWDRFAAQLADSATRAEAAQKQ